MAVRTLPCSNRLVYAIYMYFGEIDNLGNSLARQLSLHPSTLACLSNITSSLPN
jgi:hypothetical protein